MDLFRLLGIIEGVITNFIAIKEDITERKNAENRLKAQHTVTQVLAESATITEASSKILQAYMHGA